EVLLYSPANIVYLGRYFLGPLFRLLETMIGGSPTVSVRLFNTADRTMGAPLSVSKNLLKNLCGLLPSYYGCSTARERKFQRHGGSTYRTKEGMLCCWAICGSPRPMALRCSICNTMPCWPRGWHRTGSMRTAPRADMMSGRVWRPV